MGASDSRTRLIERSAPQTLSVSTALPFEPRLSPGEAFQHAGWRQARNALLRALAEGRLAILIGPPGAGKTLLLQELERTLRDAGVEVRREGPAEAAEPVALDIVRLVDDADDLDEGTLFRFAMLGKATVLAVLPSSADRMALLPGRVASTHLAPLTRSEVEDFVAAALAVAGHPADLFSAEAVAALAELSKGLPGQVNLLGQAALLNAQLDGASQVQAEHVPGGADGTRTSAAQRSFPGPRRADTEAVPRADTEAVPRAELNRAPLAVEVPQGMRRRRPALLILGGLVAVLALGVGITEWLLPATPRRGPGVENAAAVVDGDGTTSASLWIARRRPDPSSGRMPWQLPPPAERAAPATVPEGTPPAAAASAPEQPPSASARAPVAVEPARPPASPPPPPTVSGAAAPQVASRAAPSVPATAAPPPSPSAAPSPSPSGRGATIGRLTAVPPTAMRPDPESAPVRATSGAFRGTTYNETLGRTGGLQLQVTPTGRGEDVVVRFEAYRGLVGSGQLAGRLTPDGRLFASGVLMMGANPFKTELDGVLSGNSLTGSARYTRVAEPGARPSTTSGSFRLARDEP